MYTQFYFVRLLVAAIAVLADMYLLGLWIFAFIRTGKRFFLLLAVSGAGALFLGIIAAAFAYYDLSGMKRFDPYNTLYGATYFALQPLILLLAIVGQTLLVRSLLQIDQNPPGSKSDAT